MKLSILLERDETSMIVTECQAISGIVSQGKIEEDARASIRESIVACLEARAERGLPLTVRSVEVDVSVA